jgi:Tol biopolymer transport system component
MEESGDRLDSWKEIAAYLGRGVTTVQRWEQEEGLPVHRLPHAKRGSVFAFKREVDAWREARTHRASQTNVHEAEESHLEPRWWWLRHRPVRVMLAAVALGASVLAVMGINRRLRGETRSETLGAVSAWEAIVPKPLANDIGVEVTPSLSPDGERVVYRWVREGASGLYVKQIDGGVTTRMPFGDAVKFASASRPAWSPRGDLIAFLNVEAGTRWLYLVPPAGGTPHRLTSLAGIGLCWMPDGRALGFVDRNSDAEPFSIFVIDRVTGERRRLTSPPLGTFGDTHCSFSPDGQRLAVARYTSRYQADVYVTDVGQRANDDARPLTLESGGIEGLAWTPDGRSVLFGTSTGLWFVPETPTPDRRAIRITGTGSRIASPSFSRPGDGRVARLAYEFTLLDVNLWRWQAGEHDSGTVTALPGSTQWEDHPAISPDGRRIAFASNRTGANEIWTADIDGANQRQVTFHGGPVVISPQWSPDGERLVFTSQVGGNRDVYVIRADGSGSMRLTTEPSQEENPTWSRDGRWIYFQSNRQGIAQVWRIPSTGGTAVQVTTGEAAQGYESPDGKTLYFVRSADSPGVWSVPVAGGKETLLLPEARDAYWGVADAGIAFIGPETAEPRGSRLNFYDFSTRKTVTLATLPGSAWTGFSISRDARTALWNRPDSSQSDLMLIDPWRP